MIPTSQRDQVGPNIARMLNRLHYHGRNDWLYDPVVGNFRSAQIPVKVIGWDEAFAVGAPA